MPPLENLLAEIAAGKLALGEKPLTTWYDDTLARVETARAARLRQVSSKAVVVCEIGHRLTRISPPIFVWQQKSINGLIGRRTRPCTLGQPYGSPGNPFNLEWTAIFQVNRRGSPHILR